MGPFPDYDLVEIEHAIRGWVRLVRPLLRPLQADRPDVIKFNAICPIQEIRSNHFRIRFNANSFQIPKMWFLRQKIGDGMPRLHFFSPW